MRDIAPLTQKATGTWRRDWRGSGRFWGREAQRREANRVNRRYTRYLARPESGRSSVLNGLTRRTIHHVHKAPYHPGPMDPLRLGVASASPRRSRSASDRRAGNALNRQGFRDRVAPCGHVARRPLECPPAKTAGVGTRQCRPHHARGESKPCMRPLEAGRHAW